MDSDLLSRPDTCAGRLQRAAYDLLLSHEANGEIPTNGRFIFYELEGLGVVFKPKKGMKRGTSDRPGPMELTEALTVLRKVGLVPWEWIVDETRTLHEWEYASSVAEYVKDALQYASINPWDGEPPLLLVLISVRRRHCRTSYSGEYRQPSRPNPAIRRVSRFEPDAPQS